MKELRFVVLAVTLCLVSLSANATLISFEYEFGDGSVLAGLLDGTVQGDGDTIFINDFGGVTLDNVAFNSIEPSDICSLFNFCGLQPLVSFSGAIMDVFVCSLGFSLGNCSFADDGGFFLETGLGVAAQLPQGVQHTEGFAAERWSASVVPEPGIFSLLAFGLVGAAWARRRKIT